MRSQPRCLLASASAALLATQVACAGRAPAPGIDLVAIELIQQLKARYQRCIDTRDLPCLRDDVFAADTELHWKGGDYDIQNGVQTPANSGA